MKTAKEHIEIEFLKSLTYTEINTMFNSLKEKLNEKDKELSVNALLMSKVPEMIEMLKKVECNMRINTQDEIDLWKSCKKLIKEVTQI